MNPLTEGKTRGRMSPKKVRNNRRPMSPPPMNKPTWPKYVVKSFKCSCGGRFSERVAENKTKIGCRYCKGIAKEYEPQHAPPIWEHVTKVIATCPKCRKEMQSPQDADVRAMFTWHCVWCGHVC